MKTGNFIKDGIEFCFTETDDIRICACPKKGGELSSVEYKQLFPGKELLFRGNDYSNTDLPFPGRAPLMWPTVTRNYIKEVEKSIKGKEIPEKCSYRYQGKVYYIGKTAFAKDLPWKFDSFGLDGRINLRLESSSETKAAFPFDFLTEASFRIVDDTVVMEYSVKNNSAEEMFFSIGNHIGINIPLQDNSDIDSLLLYSSGTHKRKTNEHTTFTDKYSYIPLEKGMHFNHPENVFNMVSCGYSYNDNFFRIVDKNTTFKIKHRVIDEASQGVTLPDKSELYYTTYGEKSLGFICTEPWIGGINSLNTSKGLIKLQPEGVFKWEITIKWKRNER